MTLFAQYESLFSALSQDPERQLVLTPNHRLARFLTALYTDWQRHRHSSAWVSLPCLSWQNWWLKGWSGLQVTAVAGTEYWLLTEAQQNRLWRSIVAEHSGDVDWLVPDSMAKSAAQAWQRLVLWRQSWRELPQDSDETALFARWAEAFERRCEQLGALDLDRAQQRWADHLSAGRLQLPAKVHLLGFDDLNPLQRQVLDGLTAAGCVISSPEITLPNQSRRLACADGAEELSAAARWADQLLRSAGSQTPPRIGIVVPELAHMRERVEYIFTRTFEPQYLLPSSPRHANGFNISAAQPLVQTPIVAAALDILQLNHRRLERELVCRILRSPFIAGQHEFLARNRLVALLRSQSLSMSFRELCALSAQDHEDGDSLCPVLHGQLQAFTPADGARTEPFRFWAEAFQMQLQQLGWPGERALDTLEFQQVALWMELLVQLGQMDELGAEVTAGEALVELTRLAYTPFHAQTLDSPIQILGLLEAAGQQFDHLWVMNLNSRDWPPPTDPNSLLPLYLQKQWQMPRASAQRELELAQRLTQRLQVSATDVVFSYSNSDEDRPLGPSPLIEHIPLTTRQALPLSEPPDCSLSLRQPRLEPVHDPVGPPVAGEQVLRGGTAVLRDQSACPFRAFARHRLQARVEPDCQPGISPMLRGVVIHDALEALWRRLQDQASLLALDDAELDNWIREAIAHAWRRVDRQATSQKWAAVADLGATVRRIEMARAERLLRLWMALEKQRPPFRVAFQEQAQLWQRGPLKLRLRYDRIDELLAPGAEAREPQHLVMDYKTGLCDLAKWAGDRPDDPQVPLYAVAQAPTVVAAAFAQLNPALVAFVGLGDTGEEVPGLKTAEKLRLDLPHTWPALLAHWRDTLDALADEFAQGDARVSPKSPQSCRYCDLHSLCRIRQQREQQCQTLGDSA